jgi:hypothetical protein
LLALLPLILGLASAPEARAAAPGDAPVTANNLPTSERYWPYRVALIQDWKAPGKEQPLRKGTRGVLIRVESSERARIDFGRWGLYDVPVAATDLLANADRIRLGKLDKSGPNFVLAIGAHLVDTESPLLRNYPVDRAAKHRAFLLVFADPGAKEFPDLARALVPLKERADLLTILFPQADTSDADVAAGLRKLAWTAPFVIGHLSGDYGRTLLPDQAKLPALLLQTGDGRLLYSGRATTESVPAIVAALEAAFPAATAP